MRPLRKIDRSMPHMEAEKVLEAGEYGILSTVGADGQPYGVPMSYAYRNGAIYLHCAGVGHKLDNIAENPRVSFTVVGKTKVLQAKFSTEYESVIAFGSASLISGAEHDDALLWLVEKYSPDFIPEGKRYIERDGARTTVLRIDVEHLSGKARR